MAREASENELKDLPWVKVNFNSFLSSIYPVLDFLNSWRSESWISYKLFVKECL